MRHPVFFQAPPTLLRPFFVKFLVWDGKFLANGEREASVSPVPAPRGMLPLPTWSSPPQPTSSRRSLAGLQSSNTSPSGRAPTHRVLTGTCLTWRSGYQCLWLRNLRRSISSHSLPHSTAKMLMALDMLCLLLGESPSTPLPFPPNFETPMRLWRRSVCLSFCLYPRAARLETVVCLYICAFISVFLGCLGQCVFV